MSNNCKKNLNEANTHYYFPANFRQCDLLELRDAHAKLRTSNEKLRLERERYERERDSFYRRGYLFHVVCHNYNIVCVSHSLHRVYHFSLVSLVSRVSFEALSSI